MDKPYPPLPDCLYYKQHVAARLTGKVLGGHELVGLEEQVKTLRDVIHTTLVHRRNMSALVLGPHGTGKSSAIEHILNEFRCAHVEFSTVKLSGLLHTTDKQALLAIAAQLGLTKTLVKNGRTSLSFAEALQLILHATRENTVSFTTDSLAISSLRPMIIVLDEFDLFALHPKQSLLYNLFDLSQSKDTKQPICVLGVSCRVDVMDMLEKRVKSRFSQQKIWFHGAQTMNEFIHILDSILAVQRRELPFEQEGSSLRTRRKEKEKKKESLRKRVALAKDTVHSSPVHISLKNEQEKCTSSSTLMGKRGRGRPRNGPSLSWMDHGRSSQSLSLNRSVSASSPDVQISPHSLQVVQAFLQNEHVYPILHHLFTTSHDLCRVLSIFLHCLPFMDHQQCHVEIHPQDPLRWISCQIRVKEFMNAYGRQLSGEFPFQMSSLTLPEGYLLLAIRRLEMRELRLFNFVCLYDEYRQMMRTMCEDVTMMGIPGTTGPSIPPGGYGTCLISQLSRSSVWTAFITLIQREWLIPEILGAFTGSSSSAWSASLYLPEYRWMRANIHVEHIVEEWLGGGGGRDGNLVAGSGSGIGNERESFLQSSRLHHLGLSTYVIKKALNAL